MKSQPQQVMLTIGYTKLLLPDDANITTVLKALSRAELVRADRSYMSANPTIELDDDRPTIEMAYVSRKAKLTRYEPTPPEPPRPRTPKRLTTTPVQTLFLKGPEE